MKKRISLAFLLFSLASSLFAADELRNSTVESVTRREGDDRVALQVNVNSSTAKSPYSDIDWNDGVDGQKNKFRTITVQNTSAFDVLCATYSTFVGNGPRWVIPASTGSFTSYNYATFYMLVPAGTSTQTVSGVIERKKN